MSTLVLLAFLVGYILAQVMGVGLVAAQSGGVAKIQLDTSNCTFGVGQGYSLPPGAIVVEARPSSTPGENQYVYNVCK